METQIPNITSLEYYSIDSDRQEKALIQLKTCSNKKVFKRFLKESREFREHNEIGADGGALSGR